MTSSLFTPIDLAGVSFANRIVVSPMCQYSAEDGNANDWHIMHLGMLANSGASLVILEATAVEPAGRITPGDLGLYNDENEAALSRVMAAVRRYGTAKLGIQVSHAGRKASAQRPWEGGRSLPAGQGEWQTIAPSAIPFAEGWPAPRAGARPVKPRIVSRAKRSTFTAASARPIWTWPPPSRSATPCNRPRVSRRSPTSTA